MEKKTEIFKLSVDYFQFFFHIFGPNKGNFFNSREKREFYMRSDRKEELNTFPAVFPIGIMLPPTHFPVKRYLRMRNLNFLNFV